MCCALALSKARTAGVALIIPRADRRAATVSPQHVTVCTIATSAKAVGEALPDDVIDHAG